MCVCDFTVWYICDTYIIHKASLVAQLVKNPPAMQDTLVWFLGWEVPLKKEQLPTPVFWPGEFHWLYSPWGHKESDTTERLSLSLGFPGGSVGKGSAWMLETWIWALGWEDTLEEGMASYSSIFLASLVTQLVKNPPAMWETWVQSLGWEDPLEKGMANHSSILQARAWRIPWTG